MASPCHFFHKDLETYILAHGDDFFIVSREERCIRAEQSCDSGPRVVAVTDSEFLGQDTDIATVENRVRA